jgi:hypothetical protein
MRGRPRIRGSFEQKVDAVSCDAPGDIDDNLPRRIGRPFDPTFTG